MAKIEEYKRSNPTIFAWEIRDKLLTDGKDFTLMSKHSNIYSFLKVCASFLTVSFSFLQCKILIIFNTIQFKFFILERKPLSLKSINNSKLLYFVLHFTPLFPSTNLDTFTNANYIFFYHSAMISSFLRSVYSMQSSKCEFYKPDIA